MYSYGVTNSAYQWLHDHNENQCIVLSGESNSGKTETARLVVHYLSQVSEVRERDRNENIFTKVTSSAGLKSSLKSNSHIDISTASLSSSPKIFVPKTTKSSLLKQCSVESAKSTLKKCTHDKTVDFDFLHHKSNEQLPTTSAAAAAAASSSKCQKHSQITIINPQSSRSSASTKQCLKHNATNASSLSTCLKKSNCDLSVNSKIVEPHLLTCSKSFQTAPTTVSKQCQTVCDPTKSSTLCANKSNCDRCGHIKCAKIPGNRNENTALPAKVSVRNESSSMPSTIVKCNCDLVTSTNVTTKQSVGSSSGGGSRTPPPVTRKKILKSSSTTSCPQPIERSPSIMNTAASSTQCDGDTQMIRERIAQAEIFLEAIGHATTVHNYNSSRYVSEFVVWLSCQCTRLDYNIIIYVSGEVFRH